MTRHSKIKINYNELERHQLMRVKEDLLKRVFWNVRQLATLDKSDKTNFTDYTRERIDRYEGAIKSYRSELASIKKILP